MPNYNSSGQRFDSDGNSSATITGFSAAAGSRRFLEVFFLVSAGSIAAHSSVTWGGVALTKRGSDQACGTYGQGSKWYLPEASFPSGATGDIVATAASSQDQIAIIAIVSNDVDQAAPYENASQSVQNGTGTNSASQTVTSTATALITSGIMGVDSGTFDDGITVGTGTSRQEIETAGDYTTYAASTTPGASPNVTPSWTFTMTGGEDMSEWLMLGDALKDDPGGGGGGPALGGFKTLLGVGI